MPTSRSTILRLLRSIPTPEHPTPRVLGVDDWAKRKGQTYGTLLCDLERHRPVDLLSDRLADSLVDWLASHAGVEIISRDRAGAYAEGAARGAPDAIQVADRWHLLKNLGDALERLLDRHAADLRAVSRAVAPAVTEATPMSEEPPPVVPEPVGQMAPIRATADRERRRAKRVARYEEVCALHLQGASIHALAEQLGLARRTVRRYIRAETFPEIAQRPKRSCILDPYEPYLRQRWNEGCHNGYQLWREITDQGYRGGRTTISRFATRMRQEQGIPPRQRRLPDEHATTGQRSAVPKRASVRPLSARHLAWLFTRRPDDLTARQQAEVSQMRGRAASLATAYDLAQSFALMVRERRATDLLGWIEKVAQSGVAELQGFADGLCRDWDAVQAALSLPWSQGQTEGQITRLKLLKRQMYGRAGFDLLRLRMLHAA
jgi:transposase